ncbi:leucine carboxyl methyltransferase [Tanacetum coccineum]|uniref:Leucine carboxyl methyltransferase n=1 Tax=Tanacetum coccineum TaxID=301880 RepID=A0ABQ5D5V4_9ASTR
MLANQPPPVPDVMEPPLPPLPPQLLSMWSNDIPPPLAHETFCEHCQQTHYGNTILRRECNSEVLLAVRTLWFESKLKAVVNSFGGDAQVVLLGAGNGYSRKGQKESQKRQNRARNGKDKVKSKPKTVKVKKSTEKSTPIKSKKNQKSKIQLQGLKLSNHQTQITRTHSANTLIWLRGCFCLVLKVVSHQGLTV